MSRSNYSDDLDPLDYGRWRAQVASAIRGKRGQQLLHELIEALDAMEDKRLYPGSFATADGEYCALGALGAKRGTKMDDLGDDEECDPALVGERFGIARQLAAEIMYLNDEWIDEWPFKRVMICGPMRPREQHERWKRVHNEKAAEQRWKYMREWAQKNLGEQK